MTRFELPELPATAEVAGRVVRATRYMVDLMQGGLDMGHRFMGNRTYSDLKHAVHRDELTQTLNRRGLIDALDTYCEETGETSFLGVFVDVKGLGAVNNDYSHELGNRLLTVAGWGVKHTFRLPDGQALVARVGGDEFAAFLPIHMPTDERLQVQYEDLDDSHAATIRLEEHEGNRAIHADVREAMADLLLAGVDKITYRYNIGEFYVPAGRSSEGSLAQFLTAHGTKYARTKAEADTQ